MRHISDDANVVLTVTFLVTVNIPVVYPYTLDTDPCQFPLTYIVSDGYRRLLFIMYPLISSRPETGISISVPFV